MLIRSSRKAALAADVAEVKQIKLNAELLLIN